MGNKLAQPIRVSELARHLELPCHGPDVVITHVRPYDSANAGALCYSRAMIVEEDPVDAVVIAPMGSRQGANAVIEATNLRLAFAKALIIIDQTSGFVPSVDPPVLGEGVLVSDTAIIGKGVVIGSRTFIGHHVVIADGVQIGEDCIVKSNTVIGEPGFGFERDEDGCPVRMLHLGGVIIGNRVEIGSLNTVCRGTLNDTIIEDDVKTDDHVHIAHNCRVRRGSLITACAELSGGVDIGEFSWVGPNTSIIQKAVLGSKVFVGIGSNITKSIPEGVTVAGNPARVLRGN